MSAAPNAPEGGDFMTPEWMEQRARDLVAMNAHALMKDSCVLDDATLTEWLAGACIQGEADYFDSFSILFGFDRHGQDFVVVKSNAEDNMHFVLTEEGKRK